MIWLRMLLWGCPVFLCLAANAQIQVPPVIRVQAQPLMMILKTEAEAPFANQEQVLKEIYDLFVYDLQFSGAFQVVEETAQGAYLRQQDQANGAFDYVSWRQILVGDEPLDYVVKTVAVPRGPGQMQLNVLVYDIQQGSRQIGTAYGKNPPFALKDIRRAGHKATAEIITTLTNGKIKPITESRIVFVNHNVAERTKEIFVMDYDGWEKSIQQLTFYNSITIFPDWSPSGNELAYVSFKSEWPDAYVHNLTSGKVTTLANYRGTNTTPRWFPGGERLAISLSAHGNPEIYILPKTGSKNPERITNNRAIDEAPDPSPDGMEIAFTSDRIGSPQIYVMNVDGTGTRRISYIERKCDTPKWCPVEVEGQHPITFTGFFSNLQADVFTVFPDGSGQQEITDGRGDNKNPDWSPDGQYLVFSSNRNGKHDLYLASSNPEKLLPNGERFHRLTYLSGDNLSPVWSPK